MYGELSRSELLTAFKAACESSAEDGENFIHDYVFKPSGNPNETLNQEVDRKFEQLGGFAQKVLESYNIGTTFDFSRPRDYMDQLKNLESDETQALRNRIYGAFYKAGHHIRELTDRPDYIIPASAQMADTAAALTA